MALTRYLHFAFTIGGPERITALAGIEVYDVGGTDRTLALGTAGFTGQSSQYDTTTTYQGQNAFDHNDSSLWAATPNDPGWLRYDLGAAYDVRSVFLRNRTAANQAPATVKIYGSQNPPATSTGAYGYDTLVDTTAVNSAIAGSTTIAVGASIYLPFVPSKFSGSTQAFNFPSRAGPQPDKVTRVRVTGIGQDFKNNFGGRGYLSGHTYVTGTPNTIDPFARVGLYKESGGFVTSMFSDAAGFYRFDGLDTTLRYFVVLFDDTHNYNAAIKDNLTPLT